VAWGAWHTTSNGGGGAKVKPGDGRRRVNALRYGQGRPAANDWGIKSGDAAIGSAHEAVSFVAKVGVPTRDRPRWVDAMRHDEPPAARIEGGEGAIATPQEAVSAARVSVRSSDRPCRVDAAGLRARRA